MVAVVCDTCYRTLMPVGTCKIEAFSTKLIFKSLTVMNNDAKPPSGIKYSKHIWLGNYTLIWSGLQSLCTCTA